ncbi:ribonuclease H-like domain-containing protein [Mycena albidolilacea]|uniref:ribonuclease H n=1 Tax=Mycena albidolilacea TaxID=1033008 RepID=A0AAD7AKI3_9AGAR|nr:ribonuclease H-like domain-containing protein [Mycena albidolilacea]
MAKLDPLPVLVYGGLRAIPERCPGDQTNNRAELIAILRVLETVPETKKPLLIKSDSSYSLKCFKEWLPKWISNGFVTSNKDPVKNAPLIRYISTHLDARARRGQRVKLQWVKGHAGIDGNEGADTQANIGARQPLLKERDWAKLEAELKERLEIEFQGVDEPEFVPPEISDPPEDIGSGDTGKNPAKIRKTTHEPLAKTVAGPSSSRSAPQVPVVTSSSAFTDEDLAEYANGLLDDDDLFAELSD